MLRLLLRLVVNAIAFWVAVQVVPGIEARETLGTFLGVALIFGLVNALIRPVVLVLSCPLNIVTLGLFTLVVNALMLGLTAWLAQQLKIPFFIHGFVAAFIGALIISIVSWLLMLILPSENRGS